ncbi:Demethylmenaquinone methyltransferase [Methyloligella halotolerans]|uniref:Demethylmenaquinone methyltransferase n=1 Tax=Methyloligella halotolerans TaxID=1177755 RepID=A0A1E2S0H1_9HYPH|nr:methyltransferase domain-containing protein [Methyloligella halotolerans]ODA67912.1 Demethylmenaquinone methyltransferase [Methyloligella halotolerans]
MTQLADENQNARVNLDGYVHSRDMAEYERLRKQAQMWESATRRVLQKAGLSPGMHCLDVGAGPGSVMSIMAQGVGPKGAVTGIEIDPGLVSMGRDALKRRGGANFEIVEGDINGLDEIPGAPFDLAFCRCFLMHMPDPAEVLAKMRAWTKPGGVVIAQEYDFGSFAVEPDCSAMAAFSELFEGVFDAHGRRMHEGRELPAQFAAAGMETLSDTHSEVRFLPLSEMAGMLLGVYCSLFDAGRELGLVDDAQKEQFEADLRAASESGDYFCLTPSLIAVWAVVA